MQAHAETVMKGIRNYGIVERSTADGGSVYAYEVDGFGKFRLYDDANLPSLLSLPYLGFVKHNDPIYVNTRALILSKSNPFYF
jgi:meiotically up-regulated gene 157 (Mug157) protein